MQKIRIGIVGYGNVGAGAAIAVSANSDMELVAVFTRRNPKSVKIKDINAFVLPVSDTEKMIDDIDVLLLCGGSAIDLPEQGPQLAAMFNTVDSYDNHTKIHEYFALMDTAAEKNTAIIAAGWDPGLFSIMRALGESILPDGIGYTFWGRGVSQGHSDAIRQIEGVKHAVQYTIPIDSAIKAVRSGSKPTLEPGQRHLRRCYVAVEPGVDKMEIKEKIKKMPHYFEDYKTSVYFVDVDELFTKHSKMPHGGVVLHSGNTGENQQVVEFSLNLESNPEFTGSIMTAYARAAYRMSRECIFGAKTVLDVPISYLSSKDREELIKDLL